MPVYSNTASTVNVNIEHINYLYLYRVIGSNITINYTGYNTTPPRYGSPWEANTVYSVDYANTFSTYNQIFEKSYKRTIPPDSEAEASGRLQLIGAVSGYNQFGQLINNKEYPPSIPEWIYKVAVEDFNYVIYRSSVKFFSYDYEYDLNGQTIATYISENIPYNSSGELSNVGRPYSKKSYTINLGASPFGPSSETNPIMDPMPVVNPVPTPMPDPTPPTMMDPEPIPPSSNPVTMEQMMAEMIPSPDTPVDDTGGTDVLIPVQSMSDAPPAINPTPTPPEDVLIPVRTSSNPVRTNIQDFAVSAGSASTVTLAYRYVVGTLSDPLRRPPPVVYP